MKATEKDCEELLKKIESNCNLARGKRAELNRLKNQIANKKMISDSFVVEEEKDEELVDEDILEDIIDDEVAFYLDNYKTLGENFTYEDVISILPSKDNFNFEDIVNRLIAESYKEIKEINEVMFEEQDLTKKELMGYKDLIEKEKTKIEYLRAASQEDIEEAKQEIKNKIVLVPTTGGNIRVLDELEHIAIDYYDSFLELINSIIDGTFKNVKTFKSNKDLNGISEVKGFKTRVVFSRLDKHTYALITAFVKKSDVDKLYIETLKKKVAHFRDNEQSLKKLITDESFLEDNSFYVECLFDLLNPKEKGAELKKVNNND